MSKGKFVALGAGLGGVVAYVLLLATLADVLVAQRATWGVVGLVLLIGSPFAALAIALIWMWARTTSINIAARGRVEAPRWEASPEALEGEFRQLPQLEAGRYANGWPTPRQTFLPIVTQNGLSTAESRIAEARAHMERMRGPLSTPAHEVLSPVETAEGRRVVGAEVEALRKVCMACPDTPTRARCGVTSTEHSNALDVLTAHGWIVRPGVRGQAAHWADGATRDLILEWLREVEEGKRKL